MKRNIRLSFYPSVILSTVLLFPLFSVVTTNAESFISEQFTSLAQWKILSFSKIDRHSTYEITTHTDDQTALRIISNNSA